MSNIITSIKGFTDLFQPESSIFLHMEHTARAIFSLYNYEELRLPLLERTELFSRSIGLETDIVQKEMYTFLDHKNRSLTLRPEATAGIIRAYIENKKYMQEPVSKFLSMGPMFRYERPQKGRMRQFHQINCECLGVTDSYVDAEQIVMLMQFLATLDIKDVRLEVNSLGCIVCRPVYKDILQKWLSQLESSALCDDCHRRKEINPLRVLDCKVPLCQERTKQAPHFLEYQCKACLTQFSTVTMLLDLEDIVYTINHQLVRGLDYYTRTTFEVISSAIGAQGAIAGGGRYDGLVAQLGGPDIPGVGFACGMERLALLIPQKEIPRPDFMITSFDIEGKDKAFSISLQLRKAGFSGEMLFSLGSMRSIMRHANRTKVRYCLLLGPDELALASISIKNMDTGSQEHVSFDKIVSYFVTELNKK